MLQNNVHMNLFNVCRHVIARGLPKLVNFHPMQLTINRKTISLKTKHTIATTGNNHLQIYAKCVNCGHAHITEISIADLH